MLPVARSTPGGSKQLSSGRAYGPDGKLRRSARRRLCTFAWALGALILPVSAVVFISHGTPFLARALVGGRSPGDTTEVESVRNFNGLNSTMQPAVIEDVQTVEQCTAAVDSWLLEEAERLDARNKAKPLDLTFFLHVPRTAGR